MGDRCLLQSHRRKEEDECHDALRLQQPTTSSHLTMRVKLRRALLYLWKVEIPTVHYGWLADSMSWASTRLYCGKESALSAGDA
jgi:hypothetical protein